MAQEIERKFLVVGEYKLFAHNSMRIIQGYIATGLRTVRVRIGDNRAWLTIKGPSHDGGVSRYEWERQIDMEGARELMKLAVGAVIDKCRYYVEYEGHTFEVDEFYGENEGLTIAEVELQSADEEFARPAWLGKEVTGDKRYYNARLREHPYREWNDESNP